MYSAKLFRSGIFIAVMAITSVAGAQENGAGALLLQGKSLIREAVDHWNGEKMLQARAMFERLTQDESLSALAHYYVAYADYRLCSFYFESEKKKALHFIDDAIEHLQTALKEKRDFVEASALLAQCYGQKIALKPLAAIYLGPKSGRLSEQALNAAPKNPRVVLLHAMGKFFTPKMFGGDKQKALTEMRRAAELFQSFQPADSLQPDWGAEEVHAWIGLVNMDLGDSVAARSSFEQALAVNPDFGWVKYYLLPQLTDESSGQNTAVRDRR